MMCWLRVLIIIGATFASGCATMGKTVEVKVHKEINWSISITDFDRLDKDGDGRLSPAELVPSFKEQIFLITQESIVSQLSSYAAKPEDIQTTVEQIATEFAKYFAKQAFVLIDSNLDGVLSREEVAAVKGKTFPLKIDFKLTVPSPKHGAEVTKGLLPETETAFERAKALVERGEKRYVLLDFHAAWCSDSKLMDSLFANPQIQDIVREKFAYVKVDVGNEYFNQNRSLITKYDIKGVPTLVVLDSHGNIIDKKLCDKTKGFLDEKDVLDSYGNVIDKEVLEPVTEPARTSGTMDMEKLRKYLLSL